MANAKAMERLASISKATNDDLQKVMAETGCTLEEVQEAWKAVKANRKAERQAKALARFELEFKGTKFAQAVVYLTDKDRFIFRNLDKNSIIVAEERDGALIFRSITVYSEKSKKYEFGKSLSQTTKAKALLEKATEGLNYEAFYGYMMNRSNLSKRESRGAEKGISPAVRSESEPEPVREAV